MVRKRLLETTATVPTKQTFVPAPAESTPKPAAKITEQPAPLTPMSDDARAAREREAHHARPPKTAPPDADDEADAMSVATFCKRHGISRAFFYFLQKKRKGPRTIELGARTLIAREAAADWRRQREAATKRHPRPKRSARPRHRAAPQRLPIAPNTNAT